MTEKTFSFGQPVNFSHVLHRQTDGGKKRWKPAPREGLGMVIGKRTLWDGEMEYEDWVFLFEKSMTAYLVVTDIHSAPLRVLPEHMSDAPPLKVEP